jgi:hypothetical protein
MSQDPNAWWSKEIGDEFQRQIVQDFSENKSNWKKGKEAWRKAPLGTQIFFIFYFLAWIVGGFFFVRWLMK